MDAGSSGTDTGRPKADVFLCLKAGVRDILPFSD